MSSPPRWDLWYAYRDIWFLRAVVTRSSSSNDPVTFWRRSQVNILYYLVTRNLPEFSGPCPFVQKTDLHAVQLWPTEVEQIWSHLEPVRISDTRLEFHATRMSVRAISEPLSLCQDREIEGGRQVIGNASEFVSGDQWTNSQQAK
jgi:hypothetical protein